MFTNSETGQSKLYAGLAGVAALALLTACTAEEPAPEETPADQDVEQQETVAPEGDQTDASGDDATPSQDDNTDDANSANDGSAASGDEVYSIIEAVEAEYSDGIIVDIDLDDNGSQYEVDVVAGNEVYELDVSADGDITVHDTDNDDDDDIREAQQANVTVTEALDEAFGQHSDASFDQIQLDEDNGDLFWEIELDDANGSEIEMEISAS